MINYYGSFEGSLCVFLSSLPLKCTGHQVFPSSNKGSMYITAQQPPQSPQCPFAPSFQPCMLDIGTEWIDLCKTKSTMFSSVLSNLKRRKIHTVHCILRYLGAKPFCYCSISMLLHLSPVSQAEGMNVLLFMCVSSLFLPSSQPLLSSNSEIPQGKTSERQMWRWKSSLKFH